jgi:hypothetical protein
MTHKEQIILAIKNLNFKKLEVLLDDNLSYMDVTKDLFLTTLKKKFASYGIQEPFDEILEGVCNNCNKGCKAYRFLYKKHTSLPLYFEEKEGNVVDIYLCKDLLTGDVSDKNSAEIFIYFYQEEKVNFKPSLEHLINIQRVETATDVFEKMAEKGLVPIEDVVYWYNRCASLASDLKFDFLFTTNYKTFVQIEANYNELYFIAQNFQNNHTANSDLMAFTIIDKKNEREIVKWLIKNEFKYTCTFKKTKGWQKTGIIILKTKPELVVDASDYLAPFILKDAYWRLNNRIMKKYKPTNEHYAQNRFGIEYSLKGYLTLHNKYLDLFDDNCENL